MAFISQLLVGDEKHICKHINAFLSEHGLDISLDPLTKEHTLADALNKIANKINVFHLQPPEKKKYITVEQVDELIAFANKKPNLGKISMGVITFMENARAEVQNKLLKLVEEPPSYLQLMLCSHTSANVLTTIKSRCDVIDLGSELRKAGDEIYMVLQLFLEDKQASTLKAYEKLNDIVSKTKDTHEKREKLMELQHALNDYIQESLKAIDELDDNRVGELDKLRQIGDDLYNYIQFNVNVKLIMDKLLVDFLEINR